VRPRSTSLFSGSPLDYIASDVPGDLSGQQRFPLSPKLLGTIKDRLPKKARIASMLTEIPGSDAGLTFNVRQSREGVLLDLTYRGENGERPPKGVESAEREIEATLSANPDLMYALVGQATSGGDLPMKDAEKAGESYVAQLLGRKPEVGDLRVLMPREELVAGEGSPTLRSITNAIQGVPDSSVPRPGGGPAPPPDASAQPVPPVQPAGVPSSMRSGLAPSQGEAFNPASKGRLDLYRQNVERQFGAMVDEPYHQPTAEALLGPRSGSRPPSGNDPSPLARLRGGAFDRDTGRTIPPGNVPYPSRRVRETGPLPAPFPTQKIQPGKPLVVPKDKQAVRKLQKAEATRLFNEETSRRRSQEGEVLPSKRELSGSRAETQRRLERYRKKMRGGG